MIISVFNTQQSNQELVIKKVKFDVKYIIALRLAIVVVLLLVGAIMAKSQSALSNLHHKVELHPSGIMRLDSLPVLPQTVQVTDLQSGEKLSTSYYHLSGQYLIWDHTPKGSVRISYRTIPPSLVLYQQHLDSSDLVANSKDRIMGYNPYLKDEKLIGHDGLNYQGSFSRGISFGNNQNLVLDSRFNLQLGGKLKNGIEVSAVISDENLPIQAEGNTRQLKEFDRIFIQLKKEGTQLIAGDYQLQSGSGYFMKYFKKLQGATFETTIPIKAEHSLQSRASIAISKGQFAKNNMVTQEGNQGPYKLRGNSGERFIILLAGTEKVWMDGKLLVRGIEDDYTIDYNQAEITFTSKNLIKRESRVIVEFEYSAQRYLRSMYATDNNWTFKKGSLYFNFYSEQDSKTSSGELGLSNADKMALSLAGDDIEKAIVSTIDTLRGDLAVHSTYRLVKLVQSCDNQQIELEVLIYSNNEDSTLYTATFSNVGPGHGNYIIDQSKGDNERAYLYIPPDEITCEPQGQYEPVGRLIPPQKKQLLTVGSKYHLGKSTEVQGEIAMSNLDVNRFSSIDQGDNQGLAGFLTFTTFKKLGSDSSQWSVTSKLQTEWTQATFFALNPYRRPEFLRDWNLTNQEGQSSILTPRDELVGLANFTLKKDGLGFLSYGISGYDRAEEYQGQKHNATLNLQKKQWNFDSKVSYLTTKDLTFNTQFIRPNIELSKTIGKKQYFRVGILYLSEKNTRMSINADTLLGNSFYFEEIEGSISTQQMENKKLWIGVKRRTDYFPTANSFIQGLRADEFKIDGSIQSKLGYRLNGHLNYRNLTVQQQDLTTQKPASTYLGKINFQARPKKIKGLLIFNATYEIGSGQEPKQSFSYLEVAQGSGTHIWQDSLYNNDGVIQLNEMAISPFRDQANYILIRNLSDEYIQTNNVAISHSLDLNPKALWFNEKKGIKKWLKKLATKTTFQINRKTQENPNVQAWNPYQLDVADTSLVSGTVLIRNNLFINRGSSVFNLQIGQSISSRRFVQTTGLETRSLKDYFIRSDWNITKAWSLQIQGKLGEKQNQSGFYPEKDYLLEHWEMNPKFTYLPNQKFKADLSYKYRRDENVLLPNGENAIQKSLSLALSYRNTATSTFDLRLSYVDVGFDGNINSPVGFAILNGLQQGANILWSVNINRQLNKSLQVNIGYDGRKTGDARVIHTGRAQVRALF